MKTTSSGCWAVLVLLFLVSCQGATDLFGGKGSSGSGGPSTPATVAVTGVALNSQSVNLVVGASEQLTATLSPTNATNTTVSWASASVAVATVNSTGKVTAVSPGSTTVTVTSADGNKTAVCTVVVVAQTDIVSSNIGVLKLITGGTFERDATPTNLSKVSDFHMSTKPITGDQFKTITGIDDPSFYGSKPAHPVDSVSWFQAIYFCNLLSIKEGKTPAYSIKGTTVPASWGAMPTATSDATYSDWWGVKMDKTVDGYRLPTEMEYLWASMGGLSDSVPGNVVNGINYGGYAKAYSGSSEASGAKTKIGNFVWYFSNSGGTTQTVGSKAANELGLYDLSGNVWEWCWDVYGSWPTGNLTNHDGANPYYQQLRSVRGGGFSEGDTYSAVGYRLSSPPAPFKTFVTLGSSTGQVGFRVVCK